MEQLDKYFKSLSFKDQIEYANKCGTSVEYIKQLLTGFRRPGKEMALNLDVHSGGKVDKAVLIWGDKA